MSAHPRENLVAYLDGELDAATREALSAHLAGCESCRAQVSRQRQLDGALAALPRLEPSPGFEARFWARLARERDEPTGLGARVRAWLSPLRVGLGLAGVAAASVALVLAFRQGGPAPLEPDRDWEIVVDSESYELFSEDVELIEILEILENWDASDET